MKYHPLSCLILIAMACCACDVATRSISPERDFHFRQFGERCEQHVECESTYCMAYTQGAFCTKLCTEGCPDGWTCQEVESPHSSGTVGLCTLNRHQLCTPCTSDDSCGIAGSNWCMALEEGQFCTLDCHYQACPVGYTCSNVTHSDGRTGRQCLPIGGLCACGETNVGQVRGCEVSNAFGTCQGLERCGENSLWSSCDARVPQEEVCNGIDDNCNGFVDEDVDGMPCEITNEYGACPGVTICAGVSGLVCVGQIPKEEICNGLDDNCSGQIDEPFKNAQGLYATVEHCGACGQNCDVMMRNATETACQVIDGVPQCRALACEDGYFPYLGGVTCMVLPDNLCMLCSQDSDCVGPGSRCITTAQEAFCGRDCSAGSAYGAKCPEGYSCRQLGDALQCYPMTNTCLCNAANLGSARSCRKDTCVGFEWCEVQGTSHVWSECHTSSYNIEICDGLDNNCDGRIDEGMLNPETGLYDALEHCGYCFNDCSTYFKPEIHHAVGACIVTAGVAACGMGSCTKETVGGVDYEWVDTDGDASNGCECRRRLGNTSFDPPEVADSYGAGFVYIDENCDGIDGVVADAIFVSRVAPDGGNGTLLAPFNTVAAAFRAWPGANKKYILVAEGLYEEDLVLPAGVVMHGGYSVNFRTRDLVLHASTIRGREAAATIRATNIRTATLVAGFVIQGANRSQLAAGGAASIAVWLENCDENVVFQANHIEGGHGEDGAPGLPGSMGHGRTVDALLDGGNGLNSERLFGPCVGTTKSGGRAGANSVCSSANATAGATTTCPTFNWSNYQGGQAPYPNNSLNRGIGGFDMSFDQYSGSGCSHATEPGFPDKIESNIGGDGLRGASGRGGLGGRGSTAAYGSFRAGAWTAVSDATAGAGGEHGVAGGGGGGGGGTAYHQGGGCRYYEMGPSGGGGGAGGCGGIGGGRGGSGGASIAVLITATSFTTSMPILRGNLLARGQGGMGGDGGMGGAGGVGGMGGEGGVAGYWLTTKGGRGGAGGVGGRGGGGGGGAGGPSFDILGYNVSTYDLFTQNTFMYPDTVATGGLGGSGGIGASEGPGQAGVAGVYKRRQDLRQCTSTGVCAAGFTCNADLVCIPN